MTITKYLKNRNSARRSKSSGVLSYNEGISNDTKSEHAVTVACDLKLVVNLTLEPDQEMTSKKCYAAVLDEIRQYLAVDGVEPIDRIEVIDAYPT